MKMQLLRAIRFGSVLILACLVLMPALFVPRAHASGVVTTCDDAHFATALAGGGLVTFNCGPATLTVTSTKNIAAPNTTIDGSNNGQPLTITGASGVNVFNVNSGASLDLQNTTLANCNAGSSVILNSGTLTITNSTFSGNSGAGNAGVIFNSDTLTITNSTFSGNSSAGNAGVIFNNDTATITSSTFSGNSAGNAGVIFNNDTLTITNSTFSSNSAGNAGGIFNNGTATITDSTISSNSAVNAGGIFNNGTATITNSTISGNSARDAGVVFNNGMATITNSTISGNSATNGAGIVNGGSGTVTLLNTIVANSTSGGNCFGVITNGGNNIDDGMTCGWDSTNGSMSNTNPLLGPLANNGGPTQTMALLTGSPAIDGVTFNAPNGAPATDQRGISRPQGARFDIGAYELQQQLTSTPVPTMNEWGLMIFMSIAGLGSVYYLRRQIRANR